MDIEIYTDGSYSPAAKIGAFAILILAAEERIWSEQVAASSAHQMELLAVIRALEYVREHFPWTGYRFHTDSQYVMQLPARGKRLAAQGFQTKGGKAIAHQAAVKRFLELWSPATCCFIKMLAHGRKEEKNPYHRKVDLLSRRLVRAAVAERAKK